MNDAVSMAIGNGRYNLVGDNIMNCRSHGSFFFYLSKDASCLLLPQPVLGDDIIKQLASARVLCHEDDFRLRLRYLVLIVVELIGYGEEYLTSSSLTMCGWCRVLSSRTSRLILCICSGLLIFSLWINLSAS